MFRSYKPSNYEIVKQQLASQDNIILRAAINKYEDASPLGKAIIVFNPFNWDNLRYAAAREILKEKEAQRQAENRLAAHLVS